jgi:hypothetical protein
MERHQASAKLQRQACWALLTVAGSDDIARAMSEFPIAAAIVTAMVQHRYVVESGECFMHFVTSICRGDAGVQQFGCWAINNLAVAGEDVRRKLRKAGVVEVL